MADFFIALWLPLVGFCDVAKLSLLLPLHFFCSSCCFFVFVLFSFCDIVAVVLCTIVLCMTVVVLCVFMVRLWMCYTYASCVCPRCELVVHADVGGNPPPLLIAVLFFDFHFYCIVSFFYTTACVWLRAFFSLLACLAFWRWVTSLYWTYIH